MTSLPLMVGSVRPLELQNPNATQTEVGDIKEGKTREGGLMPPL